MRRRAALLAGGLGIGTQAPWALSDVADLPTLLPMSKTVGTVLRVSPGSVRSCRTARAPLFVAGGRMDPAGFGALPRLVSASRFAPYLTECSQDASRAARLYTWNVEVSSAFWGIVHGFEIALRNAIHDQMRQRYGRDDWWASPSVKLHATLNRQLADAQVNAQRAAKRHRRPVVADDVVAASTLGFWSALLGKGGKFQFETLYWQPFLSRAFPFYTGARADLHHDVDAVRLFRNRLAHHEPIFSRHLEADHLTLIRLSGYVDPECAEYLDSHSRVPEILAKRDRAVQRGFGTRF